MYKMEAITKRKNIDLPIDVFQKLAVMAAAQGRSLKKYIEQILISKANSVSIDITANPSPSGDEWFDNPDNIASVERGLAQFQAGQGRQVTAAQLKSDLGL